jgi:hypothetical protein
MPLPLADPITHKAMSERCRRLNLEFTGRQAWLGRIRQLLLSSWMPRLGWRAWRGR